MLKMDKEVGVVEITLEDNRRIMIYLGYVVGVAEKHGQLYVHTHGKDIFTLPIELYGEFTAAWRMFLNGGPFDE
jgi:hypothetical protein